MLPAKCPACGRTGRVPEKFQDKKVKCPNCDERFVVEAWYYQELGEVKGPVSSEELLHLATRGEIGPETLVRQDSDKEWMLATNVDGLFGQPKVLSQLKAARPEMPPIARLDSEAFQQPATVPELTIPSHNRRYFWVVGGVAVLLLVLVGIVGVGIYLWQQNAELARRLEAEQRAYADELAAQRQSAENRVQEERLMNERRNRQLQEEQARREEQRRKEAEAERRKFAEQLFKVEEHQKALKEEQASLRRKEEAKEAEKRREEEQFREALKDAERQAKEDARMLRQELSRKAYRAIIEYAATAPFTERNKIIAASVILRRIHSHYISGAMTYESVTPFLASQLPSNMREAKYLLEIGGDFIPNGSNVTLQEAWDAAIDTFTRGR